MVKPPVITNTNLLAPEDISLEELLSRHDQLQKAYNDLQAGNQALREQKNLLIENILSKEAREKKYLAIINNAPGALFLGKTDGTILEANEVAIAMFGYTESEFRQMRREDLFERTHLNSGYFIKDQEQYGRARAEIQMLRKSGERIYVDVSSFVFWDPLSGEDRVSSVMIDITERKEMEEALRVSNERYVYATKATFDAIWDWDIPNGHLYWGEGYEKIFGYKILGKVANHIFSFDNIHPEDRTAVFAGINEMIEGTASNWQGCYRYKKVTGEYAYVQDKAVIIRNESGKAIRMIGAMQDITERKEWEDAVQRSQDKFNSLVNTIDGIVWEADARTFVFGYVSDHAEKLLGYAKAEWMQPGFWANHIHPDDKEWAVNYCVEQTKNKKEHQFEYRMIAKDGKIVWLADFVTVILEDGEAAQLRGVMVDITAHKKTEEALRGKNIQLKELSQHLQDVREEERKYLAREVHDELGQLAAVVKMDIDWLKIKMPDVQQNYATRIQHASNTTDMLIATVRRLASELRPGMLDELGLNTSLEWLCGRFGDTNGINCSFETSFNDKNLDANIGTALFRICQESLSNIRRYAHASTVGVKLYDSGTDICMRIEDDGCGFDIKQKANDVGLVGMRERSIAVDGSLSVESEPGKGTIVSVTIPKIDKHENIDRR